VNLYEMFQHIVCISFAVLMSVCLVSGSSASIEVMLARVKAGLEHGDLCVYKGGTR
jgi:hypothetical protein